MQLKTMAIGTVIADVDQNILDVDSTFQELTGWSGRELLGKKALSFTFKGDLIANQPALDALAVGRSGFQITKRYVQPDGVIIWVENHVSKISSPQGRLLLSATTRVIDRPFGADALSFNYEWIKRACAFLVVGRQRLGREIVWAPAIEALLRLYRAELVGQSITVEQLAEDASSAPSVMQRWVKLLIERDLVEQEVIGSSPDHMFVRLTARCERTLDGLIAGR